MKQKVETSRQCSAKIAIGAMRSVWNLLEKKRQWMEVESSMKAAHDKEVETLQNRVKEEQQKTEELKKEL